MEHDLIIVGAGPAGLSLALALSGSGLRLAIVERQGAASLAAPEYDGREIALTHRSIALLQELGAWERIPANEIHPLRAAQVLNGGMRPPLRFDAATGGHAALGMLVSNHLIRRALFEALATAGEISLVEKATVEDAAARDGDGSVQLAGGLSLHGRLMVAADSRFSRVRERLGIGAEVKPVGRTMMVCRVRHDRDHGGVATEWFEHGHTLALLPLEACVSSAVLTVAEGEIGHLRAMDDLALGTHLTNLYRGGWGRMAPVGTRHFYPLVTTFAHRFAIPGAALVGDAAVGMHPVTAHGFNLGLSGAALLARQIRLALRRGSDWSGHAVLDAYERQHRTACRPLYAGTNALVRLFTAEGPSARLARSATLAVARRMPLLKSAVQRAVLQA